MARMHPTPKQLVLLFAPKATLDYYEVLRGARKPCWFIREGLQGVPMSPICKSPQHAWRAAYVEMRSHLRAFRKQAA
jgi:hypothetical protein